MLVYYGKVLVDEILLTVEEGYMNGKESISVQIKNGILKIPKILSWCMTILSLYFSWLSIKSGTLTIEWYIIVTVIVGNSIFLIICSLYEGFLYKKFTSRIELKESEHIREKEAIENLYKEKVNEINVQNEKLKQEKDNLLDDIVGLNKLNEVVITTFLDITNGYNLYSLKLQVVNDVFVSKIKKLAQINKKITEEDGALDEIKKTYDNDYIKDILDVYNGFMGESTQKLKVVLDNYLKMKNIDLGVSITIKQLNKIVTDVKEIKEIKVMTAFRDHETYVKGNREVGRREYTIYGNTDFLHCLRNSSYINNNLLNDGSYNNENSNYKNQYTCTTVVPIVWQYNNVFKLYGYLTCDAYDSEQKYTDVMDKNIAYIMNTVASLLARYFDDIQYSVQNMIYKNFFSELYEIKLGGLK